MKPIQYTRTPYIKTPRVCIVCGDSFEGTARGKYCSNKCKQKNRFYHKWLKAIDTYLKIVYNTTNKKRG